MEKTGGLGLNNVNYKHLEENATLSIKMALICLGRTYMKNKQKLSFFTFQNIYVLLKAWIECRAVEVSGSVGREGERKHGKK